MRIRGCENLICIRAYWARWSNRLRRSETEIGHLYVAKKNLLFSQAKRKRREDTKTGVRKERGKEREGGGRKKREREREGKAEREVRDYIKNLWKSSWRTTQSSKLKWKAPNSLFPKRIFSDNGYRRRNKKRNKELCKNKFWEFFPFKGLPISLNLLIHFSARLQIWYDSGKPAENAGKGLINSFRILWTS